MLLDDVLLRVERQGGPGNQPQTRVGADDPAFRFPDVRQERRQHQLGQRLQRPAGLPLDLRLTALPKRRGIDLQDRAGGLDGLVDRLGRSQVDHPDLATTGRGNHPGRVTSGLPPFLRGFRLEVEDVEPGDLDQHGVVGEGLADGVQVHPGIVAHRTARDLAQNLGQVPFLIVELGDPPLALVLLAGSGCGEGEGGEPAPDLAKLGDGLRRGRVLVASGQQGTLGERLLGQALAVDDPPGREGRGRGIGGLEPCQRERDVEGRFVGVFEEGQLLLLGEGRQDAAHMPQEGTACAIDASHCLSPTTLLGVEDRQVVQAERGGRGGRRRASPRGSSGRVGRAARPPRNGPSSGTATPGCSG